MEPARRSSVLEKVKSGESPVRLSMHPQDLAWSRESILRVGVPLAGKEFLDAVLNELDRGQVSSKDVFRVHMVLEEALVNAVISPDKPHGVRAICRIVGQSLELSLELLFPPLPDSP